MNGHDDVYVERGGRIERAPDGLFEGEEAVLHLIERIVGPLGLRVDESSPWADARLPDGSRVQTGFPSNHSCLGALEAVRISARLADHSIQLPAVGDALQFVLAGVLQRDA